MSSSIAVLAPSAAEPLQHEKLAAYQAAKQLDSLAVEVCKRAPRGHAWLVDQLLRASGSTLLNLVEGNGRSGADRHQHFRIARGSALEVDGALVLMEHRGLLRAEEHAKARAFVLEVVKCLSGLLRT